MVPGSPSISIHFQGTSPVVPTVVVASVVASVVVVARVVVASSLQNWQVASATQLQRPQST